MPKDSSGMIVWRGGDRPVHPDTIVAVRVQGNIPRDPTRAGDWPQICWRHRSDDDPKSKWNIVAYQVLEQPESVPAQLNESETSNIYDMSKARDRRMVDQLIQKSKEWQGFKIDLDIASTPVSFTGYAFHNTPKSGCSDVRIIVYDTSNPTKEACGAIRMNRAQWDSFVELGNRLLSSHTKKK